MKLYLRFLQKLNVMSFTLIRHKIKASVILNHKGADVTSFVTTINQKSNQSF